MDAPIPGNHQAPLLQAISAYAAMAAVMTTYFMSIAFVPRAWMELRIAADCLLALLAIAIFAREGWISLRRPTGEWRRQLTAIALGVAGCAAFALVEVISNVTPLRATANLREAVPFQVILIEYVLFAAVFEEALFRGYILRRLLMAARPLRAVAVQGVLCGMFHLDGYSAINFAAFGMLMGSMTFLAKSIWPAVAVRCAWTYYYVFLL